MSEITRVGFVGAGQLARMMAEANLSAGLGLEITVLGTGKPGGPQSPAAQIDGVRQLNGSSLYDEAALLSLAEKSEVVSLEIEHTNAPFLGRLAEEGHNIQPSADSLGTVQDKFEQKRHLGANHIPVAEFDRLDAARDLASLRLDFSEGLIVKTRTGGYDGRGNLVLPTDMDWAALQAHFTDPAGNLPELYAERLFRFQRELAVVGVRDLAGRVMMYPVVQTVHEHNICHMTFAPAGGDPKVNQAAAELGRATIETFEGAGVFAVEMFHGEDDSVVVNEVAPRVHNSGHWTIEGAETSQFENHLRAITGRRLGGTAMTAPAAVMINVLGTRTVNAIPDLSAAAIAPNVFVTGYGKTPLEARKIGHITVLANSMSEAQLLAVIARCQLDV